MSDIKNVKDINSSRIYLIDPTEILLNLVCESSYVTIVSICRNNLDLNSILESRFLIRNLNSKMSKSVMKHVNSTLQTEDLLELQQYRELGSIEELKEELELFRKISGSIYHKVSKDISNGKVNIVVDPDNLFLGSGS